ncbi:MAG: NYN domain-containing protein [Kordiimonadaceae bacterium]|nr:NYN domain-containing protein [Kordiimonadaceae bacterium]
MRTGIYIDGFNLYYGCLKNGPYKWLDLNKLFSIVLGRNFTIEKVKYFTARIKATPADRSAPQRQDVYIRALKEFIPDIEIHFGHFMSHKVRMANANPPPNTLEVIKTEEKGSDVNLAVHVLNDSWQNKYDCAVIVSNDSDMAEAMKLIKTHHPHIKLGLVTPSDNRTSQQLKIHADFVRLIRESALRNSQLPDLIPGTTIHKPTSW